MPKNTKQSSTSVTHIAAQILKDPNASAIQKRLAGSVLSQSYTQKETGADMEAIASQALRNPNSSDITKTLAGSVVSQANKKR